MILRRLTFFPKNEWSFLHNEYKIAKEPAVIDARMIAIRTCLVLDLTKLRKVVFLPTATNVDATVARLLHRYTANVARMHLL